MKRKLKTYNNFINESLKDKLKGKSKDDILKNFKKSNIKDYKIFINSCEYGLMDGVLYSFNNFSKDLFTDDIINWGFRRSAYNGHLNIVKYLIEEKNANIHDTNDFAFRNACENGDLEMVKYLVENGANIYVNDSEYIDWRLTFKNRTKKHKDVLNYLKSIDKRNKNTINESLKDKLKGKSKDEIKSSFDNESDLIYQVISNNYDKSILSEDVIEDYNDIYEIMYKFKFDFYVYTHDIVYNKHSKSFMLLIEYRDDFNNYNIEIKNYILRLNDNISPDKKWKIIINDDIIIYGNNSNEVLKKLYNKIFDEKATNYEIKIIKDRIETMNNRLNALKNRIKSKNDL